MRRVIDNDEFPIEDPVALELLVNRQVLEYFEHGRESFRVHPALAKVSPQTLPRRMIDFSTTTAFGLVRRMAALGQNAPSIYLLICESTDLEAVQADLAAEVEVQLATEIRSLDASVVGPFEIRTS